MPNPSKNETKEPLSYEAYYKYQNLNRLMRYLSISLGLLESYQRIGKGFRFDAFEPVHYFFCVHFFLQCTKSYGAKCAFKNVCALSSATLCSRRICWARTCLNAPRKSNKTRRLQLGISQIRVITKKMIVITRSCSTRRNGATYSRACSISQVASSSAASEARSDTLNSAPLRSSSYVKFKDSSLRCALMPFKLGKNH